MNSNNSITQFKIVVVGDAKVGKSTYVKRLCTSQFEKNYVATLGVEVHLVRLKTNYGEIVFNIWDCAGNDRYRGLSDGYYIYANGCIIMHDITNPSTKENIGNKWLPEVRRVFNNNPTPYNVEELEGKMPIVICGTKKDIENPQIGDCSISSKTNENLYKPMLELARALMNKPDLVFF